MHMLLSRHSGVHSLVVGMLPNCCQIYGEKMYILLAVVYTFGSVFCLLLLPKDTKGKLLNDRVLTRDNNNNN